MIFFFIFILPILSLSKIFPYLFKSDNMGQVYADIEIINGEDLGMVRRGYMDRDEVKRMFVNILVDSGAYMLCINENLQEILQFPVMEKQKFQLADSRSVECDIVSSVELKFKNRRFAGSAIVLPGDTEPLLGMIPLEEMDVLIDAKRQELIVNPAHPDGAVLRL
jgi:clan AA aspartic protease